jgi:anti-anti-sigma factor
MRETAATREPASAGRPAITVGSVTVRLHGDLNVTTAPALREHLDDALGAAGEVLIIDLSGVSSSDTAGLAVLIGIQRRARARGCTVRLVAPGPQIAELLRVTGLDSSFTISPPSAPWGARDGHHMPGGRLPAAASLGRAAAGGAVQVR